MTARRKPRAAPDPVIPTENQMDHALAAFADAKVRYRLIEVAPSFIVQVMPQNWSDLSKPVLMDAGFTVHRFHDEPSARQWRKREIIREAITAGMRAKP